MKEIIHTKKWFMNRIGKRIFRKKMKYCCPDCNSVGINGLMVGNESHADYLFSCQNEMELFYADRK